MENPLHQILKQGTADLHRKIEGRSLLSRVMSADFSDQEYTTLLEIFYSFYEPLESKLQRTDGLGTWIDSLSERWKVNSLRKDLGAVPHSTRKFDKEIQDLSLSQAFGVLYVLEGSTLGGQVIHRQLKANPALSHRTFHFYNHYGARTGEYWQKFLKAMEAASNAGQIEKQPCLDAARAVFEMMIQEFAVEA